MTTLNLSLARTACAVLALYALNAPAAWAQLNHYTPYATVPVTDWVRANQTVQANGGWREYAKQAQQALKAMPVAPSTAPELSIDSAIDHYLQLHKITRYALQDPELHESLLAVRQHWVRAVGANMQWIIATQAHELASVTRELVLRMTQTGNTSGLNYAKQHFAYARSAQALAISGHEAQQAKNSLQNLLSLRTPFSLPAQLPALPKAAKSLTPLDANQQRLLSIDGIANSYKLAFDLAHHGHTQLVPLQQTIVDETVLQYNGMLVGTTVLLEQQARLIDAQAASAQALMQFWLADAALDATLAGIPTAITIGASTNETAQKPKH